MKKIPSFIWGIVQLVLALIIAGLIFYANTQFSLELSKTLGGLSKIFYIPLLLVGFIISYGLNISSGTKLLITSFSKGLGIKIPSIILFLLAVALLVFNIYNTIYFVQLIQM